MTGDHSPIRSVQMYDLYQKGNYVGSFRTKRDVEAEVLRIVGSGRHRGSPLTAIRSLHFLVPGQEPK